MYKLLKKSMLLIVGLSFLTTQSVQAMLSVAHSLGMNRFQSQVRPTVTASRISDPLLPSQRLALRGHLSVLHLRRPLVSSQLLVPRSGTSPILILRSIHSNDSDEDSNDSDKNSKKRTSWNFKDNKSQFGFLLGGLATVGLGSYYFVNNDDSSEQQKENDSYTDSSTLRSEYQAYLKKIEEDHSSIPPHARYQALGVSMRDQKTISLTPHDQQSGQIIFTNGLGGCIAAALIVQYKSGLFSATMSHYPPGNFDVQVARLRNSIFDLQKQDDEIVNKELVVLVPGDWKKDDDGHYSLSLEPSEEYQIYISKLSNIANINAKVSPYDRCRFSVKKSDPDFKVILNSEGASWCSFGDYHRTHKAFSQDDECKKNYIYRCAGI